MDPNKKGRAIFFCRNAANVEIRDGIAPRLLFYNKTRRAVERFIYWILDSLYNEGTWSYLFYLKLNDVKNLEQHAGPDQYVHHN